MNVTHDLSKHSLLIPFVRQFFIEGKGGKKSDNKLLA